MLRIVLLLCVLWPIGAVADDWDALKAEGAIALMRHALAPGGGDPANFELGKCETQRNLSDQGRDQARRIGEALRARGLEFEQVWTSQWCRCRETAKLLGLGDVEELPSLNSFFRDRSTEAEQTQSTLDELAQTDGLRMLVTHQVNITALTGVFPRSGEIIVVEEGSNGLTVTGRVLIAP